MRFYCPDALAKMCGAYWRLDADRLFRHYSGRPVEFRERKIYPKSDRSRSIHPEYGNGRLRIEFQFAVLDVSDYSSCTLFNFVMATLPLEIINIGSEAAKPLLDAIVLLSAQQDTCNSPILDLPDAASFVGASLQYFTTAELFQFLKDVRRILRDIIPTLLRPLSEGYLN